MRMMISKELNMILVLITRQNVLTKFHGNQSFSHYSSSSLVLSFSFSLFSFSLVICPLITLKLMVSLHLEFLPSFQDSMKLGLHIIHGGVLQAIVLQPYPIINSCLVLEDLHLFALINQCSLFFLFCQILYAVMDGCLLCRYFCISTRLREFNL